MQSMHVGAYDKAAATASAGNVRRLTVAVLLLIAAASVTATLQPDDSIGPFARPLTAALFLLASLTTWFLFRLRSGIKRSADAAELILAENRRLRESEERYRTIVTATPDLVLIG